MIGLAIRYLLAKRRQTILMLLGIFFGAASYVTISGFMLGFRGYLVDQLVNNNPHIHIEAREEFLTSTSLNEAFYNDRYTHVFWSPPPSGRKDNAIVEKPQGWYARLRADPRVAAFSPQLSASVIFTNGKATAPTTLIGCDPLQQEKVTTIGGYIVEGKFSDIAAGGNRVVIGKELQRRLGVRLAQNILVSLGKGPPSPFKIVGVFDSGNKMTDNVAYGSLVDVQKVNGSPNHVNKIAVRLFDHTQAAALATAWANFGPEKVESWDQINANVFDVFRIQDAIRFLSIGAIMVVAGFGIYNVLNMMVIQKRRDIAILRSMGYSTREIISLFFTQGFLLGITGVALGLSSGYGICLYLRTIPFKGNPMQSAGYMLVSTAPEIYLQAGFLALATACLASVLPARAAGKLTPIEIIRSGAE